MTAGRCSSIPATKPEPGPLSAPEASKSSGASSSKRLTCRWWPLPAPSRYGFGAIVVSSPIRWATPLIASSTITRLSAAANASSSPTESSRFPCPTSAWHCSGLMPICSSVWASSARNSAGLAQTPGQMGIRPEQCHAEVGHGNLELSVGEDEALAAADKRVMVLEAIRGVAHRMGLETTMAPKPYLEGAGNGHHLHLSLYEGDVPLLFDGSGALRGPGSGFVAGILQHMPAVMAFTAPSPNSYQRLAPGMWASAYAAYGLDNREAAVRLASPVAGRESATANVEFKPVDVTSNPYLALAAVLAAGLDGIERGLDPGEPTMVDPATLSDGERASRGILPLPASPDEALDALEEDRVLIEALGEPLVRTHVAVARAQANIARELPPEEVADTAAMLY